MSFWRRLRGSRPSGRRRKVPILGVAASGKSSLILTLGQYISLHGLGEVAMSSSKLFGHYLKYVAAGEPLPATARWEACELNIARIREADGALCAVDVTLSSEDIPGRDFQSLVDELRANPNLSTSQARQGGEILKRFTRLLSSCDGFIFLVDLVREKSAEEFAAESRENVWAAFAEQIEPIMTGLLVASRMNAVMAHKPIFFVFSKPDVHRLTPDQVREHFRRAMAIPLAQLRGELINVRHYDVQCAGWRDTDLEDLGVGRFLCDLIHAVNAVPNP